MKLALTHKAVQPRRSLTHQSSLQDTSVLRPIHDTSSDDTLMGKKGIWYCGEQFFFHLDNSLQQTFPLEADRCSTGQRSFPWAS
jgi:hypothetical protein